jgi:hypothetical protein
MDTAEALIGFGVFAIVAFLMIGAVVNIIIAL